MRLLEVLQGVAIKKSQGKDVEITGISYDSREVKPGDLFVCIKGFKSDGHRYLDKAVQAGAAAALVSEEGNAAIPTVLVEDTRKAMALAACNFYGNPSEKIKVVGVTGTNGKTTVTHLLREILQCGGHQTGLIGTNEIIIGSKVIPAERTTPEAPVLQRILAEMVRRGEEYCVMEVSSHSLELERVFGTKFACGVFTNLTHDHLDLHKTMENYQKAKAKLFSMCEIAVVNMDDPHWQGILEGNRCRKILGYGIHTPCTFQAKHVELKDDGTAFEVEEEKECIPVRGQVPGLFSVYNALAAFATARALGICHSAVQEGLFKSHGAKGRAEMIPTPTNYGVMIDYAHTPDGLWNILNTVKEFVKGRILIVFGCPGERDKEKRPVMGKMAGQLCDYAIITADNPAAEQAMDIMKSIEKGILETDCPYELIEDRKAAIHRALQLAKDGDLVLLAGKGHETYQIIGEEKVPFSEEKIVKEYF